MRKPTASPTRQSTSIWETLEEWVREQVRAFVQRGLEDEVTGICGGGRNRSGECGWDRKYAPAADTLEQLEREARRAKRGLWVLTVDMPPGRLSLLGGPMRAYLAG